jgi:hypothetical protein
VPKLTAYRYDNREYADNEIIRPRGDPFKLTPEQQIVETAIRRALPNGEDIRTNSIYAWEDEAVARKLWDMSGKKNLYTLEIDDADVRHRGDVNCYSTAVDAVTCGKSSDEAVEKYCKSEGAGPDYRTPRIELLVSEARVIRKLASKEQS